MTFFLLLPDYIAIETICIWCERVNYVILLDTAFCNKNDRYFFSDLYHSKAFVINNRKFPNLTLCNNLHHLTNEKQLNWFVQRQIKLSMLSFSTMHTNSSSQDLLALNKQNVNEIQFRTTFPRHLMDTEHFNNLSQDFLLFAKTIVNNI